MVNGLVVFAFKSTHGERGIATVDEDFVRLEKRFNELVKEIDVLRQQSHAFRDAIAGSWDLGVYVEGC